MGSKELNHLAAALLLVSAFLCLRAAGQKRRMTWTEAGVVVGLNMTAVALLVVS